MEGLRGASARILIVDNDLAIVELVAWFLEKRGYAVRKATSFREARALIEAETPDLLLSDLDLGDENALEELPILSRAGLLPPTLVVSGYLDPLVAAELCALPEVLGTLAKPFDLPVLERRLAIHLSQGVEGGCVEVNVPGDLQAGMDADADADWEMVAEAQEAVEAVEADDGWIEILPGGEAVSATIEGEHPPGTPQPRMIDGWEVWGG